MHVSTNEPGMVPPPPPGGVPQDGGPVPPAAPVFAAPSGAAGVPPAAPYGPPAGAPTGSSGMPSAAPYGAAAGGPGFVPAPGAPAPAAKGRGLAIAALVVSLVALLLSWVPIVNNLAAVLAVVGLGLAIGAIVGAVRKGRPGKGMAIAAAAVSVVSVVVVVVTQLAYAAVVDEVLEDLGGTTSGQLQERPAAADDDESGDGATPSAAAATTASELAVVETAFGQSADDPTAWWYVVIVSNPNTEHVFPFAGFDVEAVGADGTILDTSSAFLDLLPGRAVLSGRFYSVGQSAVDHLDVRGPGAEDAVRETELGAFTVADLAVTSDDWSTTVGGNLSGSFAQEQTLVQVDVVARDEAGAIVDAETTYVERLPVGGQAHFEAMFMSDLPDGTTFEVYPTT